MLKKKKKKFLSFTPVGALALSIIDVQRFKCQISQARSFQNLIIKIQLKILYNLEQVCQNFTHFIEF